MLLTGIAIVLFIVFVLGVVGNAIVLFVLLKQRQSWSVATTYLFNLALADMLFICIVPFWGHYYLSQYAWSFGIGMCKLTSVVTSVNMYASIFFLTAMSVDRWMAVVHATSVNLFRTSVIARWVCFSVWSAALILSIPRLLYQTLLEYGPHYNASSEASEAANSSLTLSTTVPQEKNDGTVMACAFYLPQDYPNRAVAMGCLEMMRVMLGFVIPMIVICICYMKIVNTVKQKMISKRLRKDRVANLAIFIVTAFFVCWLPFQTMLFYSAAIGWWTDLIFDKSLFNKIYSLTTCLAFANSCINPIVYAFTTTNFQDNIKDMCGSEKNRAYRMTVGHENQKEKKNANSAKDIRASNGEDAHKRRNCKNDKKLVVHVHAAEEGIVERLHPAEPDATENQSFSYYSCPAVMEGLGKAQEYTSDVGPIPPYSSPGVDECESCSTCEVREQQARH